MLPHPHGEAASISVAFRECHHGLYELARDELDENASDWIRRLEELMDTSGIEDSSGRGIWELKGERMSVDEKLELSRVVDELAHWFDRRFWGDT